MQLSSLEAQRKQCVNSRIRCANTHARAHTLEAPEPCRTRGFRTVTDSSQEEQRSSGPKHRGATGGWKGSEEEPARPVSLALSRAKRGRETQQGGQPGQLKRRGHPGPFRRTASQCLLPRAKGGDSPPATCPRLGSSFNLGARGLKSYF